MDHFLNNSTYYDYIVVGMGLWNGWSQWRNLQAFDLIYDKINDVRQAALDKSLLEDIDYEL